jgi:hypothetical protein
MLPDDERPFSKNPLAFDLSAALETEGCPECWDVEHRIDGLASFLALAWENDGRHVCFACGRYLVVVPQGLLDWAATILDTAAAGEDATHETETQY